MVNNSGYMSRTIDAELLAWAGDDSRKPLLLRGARQVGKSSAVRHLGEHFEYFVEVNFENDKEARDLFARGDLSPQQLCEGLVSIYDTPIEPGKTLLFLDEIQASIPAIMSLRYFYEKYNELHVIAAGSLLEFALREVPSFGVGRISIMFVYPMSFSEFLMACGNQSLLKAIQNASFEKPLLEPIHSVAVEKLKYFLMIGGMPSVVYEYVKTKNLHSCQKVLNDLIFTLRTDFAKYKANAPTLMISEVFNSVAEQMGKKFVYANVHGGYNHRQLKDALELLKMSGLVIPVTHTSANGLPVGAGIDHKKQKMLLLDTGLFQRMLKLPLSDILIRDELSLINKGCIAELFTGLEILKSYPSRQQNDLYYWHRESKSSNAEVDYVVQKGWDIIPLEVKSNTKGSMQSMRIFLEEKKAPFGIRTSLENFGELSDIKIVPLYAVGKYVAALAETLE